MLGTLALGAFLVALNIAIDILMRLQISDAVKREAEASATAWSSRFVTHAPAVAELVKRGVADATQDQTQRLRDAVAIGSVFKVRLFNPDGLAVFASEEAEGARKGAAAFDPIAREVFLTGRSDVRILDESGAKDGPESAVEAYIRAVGEDGRALGVAAVSVDVAAIEQVLRRSFSQLGLWLAVGSFLLFLGALGLVQWRGYELRLFDRRLSNLKTVDQLTGALNREALNHEISRVFAERREGESIGLLLVDIDGFKVFNEAHGNPEGDKLLQRVAAVLKSCVRTETDIVGRYGGDEFVVVCRAVDKAALAGVVRRIRAATARSGRIGDAHFEPTLSIGAHLSAPGEHEDFALHAVDLAVDEAKRRGRNKVVSYFDQLENAFQKRRYLERLLRLAVERELLELHFQPVFRAFDQKLLGFEALLRMRDPAGGLISPGDFIPLAEELGLIEEIGAWVLREAVKTASGWPEHLFIAVNISIAQFRSGRLPFEIQDALESHALDPRRLELEVTESLLIEDKDAIWSQLGRIKALGASVAIDDFGAGNTSIGYMWKFGFDKIKLDRSFLDAHESDVEGYKRLLRAIIALSKTMGLTILAEGVELEEQLEVNAELGVDQVQGFLLGRPAPVAELDAIIGAPCALREAS